MRTRKLGSSDISVSEISLGTWGLSGEAYGKISQDTVDQTLDAALDSGVNFIETAHCYGPNGSVEKAIGALFQRRGRSSAMVSVRIGVERKGNNRDDEVVRKRFEGQAFIEMTHASLKRMGTDYMDVLLMHNPLPSTVQRHKDAMFALRTEGLARLVGVSAGSIDVAREALKLDIDVIELPYNALYSKMLNGLAAEIVSKNVGVLVRSPFAYGVLAGTWAANRNFEEYDHRNERWTPQELAQRCKQREALRFLADEDPQIATLREAALRYVLANRMLSTVVVGARTPDHIRQNAAVSDKHPYLSMEQLSRVAEELRNVGVI